MRTVLAARMTRYAQASSLEILAEQHLLELPRGRDDNEVLRVSFTRARGGDGREMTWHSIRVWYRDTDDTLRPGKQGVTIRNIELRQVARVLAEAVKTAASSPMAPASREDAPGWAQESQALGDDDSKAALDGEPF